MENTVEDRSAWPDALAFAAGLGAAWWAGWTAADLVWSLWLSSLVVGYATMVWTIFRPGVDIVRGVCQDRALVTQALAQTRIAVTVVLILLLGALLVLAFFTLHFGMFHYVHSQFLASFFPIDTAAAGRGGITGMATYLEVARRYWWFLPAAFLAERGAFLRKPAAPKDDLSVTAAAIAARKAANARNPGPMLAPYRNVMRMHVLIFFFAFAHFARLDNFAVYTVVYAAYFFPWRVVRRQAASAGATPVEVGRHV